MIGSAGQNSASVNVKGCACDKTIGCLGGAGSLVQSSGFRYDATKPPLNFYTNLLPNGRGGGATAFRSGLYPDGTFSPEAVTIIAGGGGAASLYAKGSAGNDPTLGAYTYSDSARSYSCDRHLLVYDAANGTNYEGSSPQGADQGFSAGGK